MVESILAIKVAKVVMLPRDIRRLIMTFLTRAFFLEELEDVQDEFDTDDEYFSPCAIKVLIKETYG